MSELSFKKYIDLFWQHLRIICLGTIVIASFLWYFFPTHGTCCDSHDYWESSESFYGIRTSHYKLGTFFYPSLIALVRYLPNHLNISIEIQYYFLSIIQLFLHLISVIALSYAIYLLTKNRFITCCTTYIYGWDIFIIAYTNQILADGVAISCFLVVFTFFIVVILNPPKFNQLILLLGLLSGLLPTVRPTLSLVAISLYGIGAYIYVYRRQFKLNSLLVITIGLCFFLIPLFFQLWLNPQILLNWSQQMKNNFAAYGMHGYKAMTILDPIPHMFVAFDNSMKNLVSSCEILQAPTACMVEKLAHNPLPMSNYDIMKWYIWKFFALNDQVYLTPYVHFFLIPNRNIWRFINCLFLSTSVFGMMKLIHNLFTQIKKYCVCGAIVVIILISLLLPPILSVFEEERFGLPFHSFFAVCTSFFITEVLRIWKSKSTSRYWLATLFSLMILLTLAISLKMESIFGLRV